MQKMLDNGVYFSLADTVQHGIRILKGISALHRLDISHRDIKPDNVLICRDESLRIIDLGVAVSLSEDEEHAGSPGTPSYMAPELLSGETAEAAHDLYAAGVVLYHLLTRKYPYGEIEPFQHPVFGDPVAPTRYRPEIPGWLENVLLKSVSREASQRFETAEEFIMALEWGANRPLSRRQPTPLALRNPVLTWRIIAALSLFVNLVFLILWFQ
ncbi:MAG: serine/threonine-protein kinase [Betaproteobacteria bacterium]